MAPGTSGRSVTRAPNRLQSEARPTSHWSAPGGRPCHCPSDLLRVGPSACHDGDSPSGSSQPSSPDARCEAAVQVNTGSARALSPACTRLELSWPQVAGPGGEPAGGRPVGPVTAEFRVCIHGLTFLLAARPPGNLPGGSLQSQGARLGKYRETRGPDSGIEALTWAGPTPSTSLPPPPSPPAAPSPRPAAALRTQ